MLPIYRTIAVSIVLLFSLQSAHAAPKPVTFVEFGDLDYGADVSTSSTLPDLDPNVAWFQFTLLNDSNVSLSTEGSLDLPNGAATILALYDDGGGLLDQNFECPADSDYSCLFSDLGAGTYMAGVTDWFLFLQDDPPFFVAMWDLTEDVSGNSDVILGITVSAVSAVPVPAAVWLFGTALIGFVGMSRRRKVA
jgi:hypothetical protein